MSKTLRSADLFCGAGGSSTGLYLVAQEMGRKLDLVAVNHWQPAIDTHSANHPRSRHYCAALEHVDPREAVPSGRLDLLIASPECIFHSRARGGKPINDQRRASAWHVLRWLEVLYVESVLIENVPEFQSWGPLGANGRPLKSRKGEIFRAFIAAIEALGYRVKWRVLNAADYGDPTTRQRLFLIARRGRGALEWPEPTHSREGASTLFGALPRWRPAREIIDWSIPGKSIFNRDRPLKPKTLERIYAGLRKFGGVSFVTATGGTEGQGNAIPPTDGSNLALVPPFVLGQHGGSVARETEEPLPTITTDGAIALVQPFLVPVNYGEREGQAPRSHDIDSPVPTVVGSVTHGVVQPFLVQFKGTSPTQVPGTAKPINGPVGTLTGSGADFGLCEPFLVQLSQSGSNGERLRASGRPVPTITTADDLAVCEPFLVQYHGAGECIHPVSEPLRTVDTRDRYALVTVNGTPALLDVRFRMLQPHELAAAMGFPRSYQFKGKREFVVKMIGNAVPVMTAYHLCKALLST